MKTLEEQVLSYASYHKHFMNKLTHFVGVPMIVFSIFIPMGWFRLYQAPEVPFTGATVFFLVTMTYYLRLNWKIALSVIPTSGVLLLAADAVSKMPFSQSLLWFAVTFIVGWIIQLTGHVFEGKKPALADNLMQIFNAPLFLTIELAFLFGFLKELNEYIEQNLA